MPWKGIAKNVWLRAWTITSPSRCVPRSWLRRSTLCWRARNAFNNLVGRSEIAFTPVGPQFRKTLWRGQLDTYFVIPTIPRVIIRNIAQQVTVSQVDPNLARDVRQTATGNEEAA